MHKNGLVIYNIWWYWNWKTKISLSEKPYFNDHVGINKIVASS